MLTQWECLLKNLGEWRGSFATFSPQGELIEDTPSILVLEKLDDHKTVRLKLRRFPPNQPPNDVVFNMTSLNRSLLFFENGAFSQGAMFWGPFSEFGAEFSLIERERRLRMIQLFNADTKLKNIILIREKLAASEQPERPPLTVDQLLGEWQGEVVTIYADFRRENHFSSHLQIELQGNNYLGQKLTFNKDNETHTIASRAKIEGNRLLFTESQLPVQVLLLPDGASANCPLEIKRHHSFLVEVGWLISPTQRQRIIRSYNDKGEWVSLTLVKEKKV